MINIDKLKAATGLKNKKPKGLFLLWLSGNNKIIITPIMFCNVIGLSLILHLATIYINHNCSSKTDLFPSLFYFLTVNPSTNVIY